MVFVHLLLYILGHCVAIFFLLVYPHLFIRLTLVAVDLPCTLPSTLPLNLHRTQIYSGVRFSHATAVSAPIASFTPLYTAGCAG